MEKFKSNENLKNKQSTFSILKNFFKKSRETEDKLFRVYDKLEKVEKDSLEYQKLDKEATILENRLKKFEEAKSNMKKFFLKLGSLALGGTLAVIGTVSLVHNSIESSKNDLVLEALAAGRPAVVNIYKNDSDKLKALAESPEEITKLALDTLKHKLADHYGVNNKDDFKISYRTESPDHTRYGYTEYYQIFYKGEEISAHTTNYNSGDVAIIKDTMPKEIIDVIDSISAAQYNPESSIKAYKALKDATSKETDKGIAKGLSSYLPVEHDVER